MRWPHVMQPFALKWARSRRRSLALKQLEPSDGILQPHLMRSVTTGFVLAGWSSVPCWGLRAVALKSICSGLLIDQNVKSDRSSLFCLPKENPWRGWTQNWKGQLEIPEPNLGFAFEDPISVPPMENKTESKGTEIAVAKKTLFFASCTSRVEFSLTRTQLRNC